MILVDTNILARLAQPGHPQRQPAREAIRMLTSRDRESIAIVPQNLYELYVVCSRPIIANGLGMDSARFMYFNFPENGVGPMLVWQKIPPFGKRIYHFEDKRWGYID